MSDVYRIYGAELSPYSVKVRSYFRYKGIPHTWLIRNTQTQADYQKYAKLPIIPLVVTPSDQGVQDSTPIIERLEAEHPEPSIHPSDPVAAFVSALLEEFGDEWGNKWMFHLRWAREVDQIAAAGRIASSMLVGADDAQIAGMAGQIRERMLGRVWFVGSNEQTAPQIERSFRDALGILEAHLTERAYLFGGRPAFGDFGLWSQVYEAWTDPTAGAWIEGGAPNVLAWIQRMTWPRALGDFEAWSALEPTLMPLLETQVGGLFLPWSLANARAVAEGQERFSIELGSGTWTQKPQKYHAKTLGALRAKYAAVADKAALDAVLERAGCLAGLRA
jgi:glutathione S-transferase